MKKQLFRLVPAAAADDPNWDRAKNHGEVIVRATSHAEARLIASQAEADFLESRARPGDDVSTRFASAFRDEKLYSVLEINGSSEISENGPTEVVSGTIHNPLKRVIKSGNNSTKI